MLDQAPVQMPRELGQHNFERRSYVRFDQVPAVRGSVCLADHYVCVDFRCVAVQGNVSDEG